MVQYDVAGIPALVQCYMAGIPSLVQCDMAGIPSLVQCDTVEIPTQVSLSCLNQGHKVWQREIPCEIINSRINPIYDGLE